MSDVAEKEKPISKTQRLLDERWEQAKRGEVDYSRYRDSCPLRSRQCDNIQCTDCKYYVTPPTAEDIDVACKHCESKNLALIDFWRPNHEVPTEDGKSSCFKPVDIIYGRYTCIDCRLIIDIECPKGYDLTTFDIDDGRRHNSYILPKMQIEYLSSVIETMSTAVGLLIDEVAALKESKDG